METNQSKNININKYTDKYKEAKDKVYKYCSKCGRQLEEGSTSEFCDQWCRSEYFAEIRRENDARYREFTDRC